MTPIAEARVRAAVAELADALLAALDERDERRDTPPRLLSVAEAAAALGIGRSAAYAELSVGRLASVKVGRRRLVPAAAIERYITERAA